MKNWCLEIWGDYACFTRPEMKVERVSYDVITPSAVRAIFESILWKPAIKWHITKIEVLNPIKWATVRRNEVKKICKDPNEKMLKGLDNTKLYLDASSERTQRASLLLKHVKYRIYGYFEFIPVEKRNLIDEKELFADIDEEQQNKRLDETEAKYAAMFERRAKKGQCFNRPYLGCREFSCNFKLITTEAESITPLPITDDLGWMLYDMDFSNKDRPIPCFFKAKIVDGTVNTDIREIEVRK